MSPPRDLRATTWARFASTALAQALSEGPAQIDAGLLQGLDARAQEEMKIRIIQQHQLGNVLYATTYADAMMREWERRYELESAKEPLICSECGRPRTVSSQRSGGVMKCAECWNKEKKR
jgi:hypothetical protein